MYWCVMQSGQHDGFVRWNVTVGASLTRGMQGVAGVYTYTDTLTSKLGSDPPYYFTHSRAQKGRPRYRYEYRSPVQNNEVVVGSGEC